MGFIEISITDLQRCLGWLHDSTLKRLNPVSLLVNGHFLDIFKGNCTESDLALNPCLRLFKSAAQVLGKTEKNSQTTLNRRDICSMKLLCQFIL